MFEQKPDVVVLTEHGLSSTLIKDVRLINYTLVTAFCRSNHLKGGVAIFKSEQLSNAVQIQLSIDIKEYCTELICEVSGIKYH